MLFIDVHINFDEFYLSCGTTSYLIPDSLVWSCQMLIVKMIHCLFCFVLQICYISHIHTRKHVKHKLHTIHVFYLVNWTFIGYYSVTTTIDLLVYMLVLCIMDRCDLLVSLCFFCLYVPVVCAFCCINYSCFSCLLLWRYNVTVTFVNTFLVWTENGCIWIQISLKFIPKGLINSKPVLAKITARHHIGNGSLSEAVIVSITNSLAIDFKNIITSIWWWKSGKLCGVPGGGAVVLTITPNGIQGLSRSPEFCSYEYHII